MAHRTPHNGETATTPYLRNECGIFETARRFLAPEGSQLNPVHSFAPEGSSPRSSSTEEDGPLPNTYELLLLPSYSYLVLPAGLAS